MKIHNIMFHFPLKVGSDERSHFTQKDDVEILSDETICCVQRSYNQDVGFCFVNNVKSFNFFKGTDIPEDVQGTIDGLKRSKKDSIGSSKPKAQA